MRYCQVCLAAFQNLRTCPRDGVATRADIGDPLIGAVLGERYRIIDRRASGGMGQVYQAAHTRMASEFAVKVLFGDLAYDKEMRERFAREAEIASLLQSRHIVRVVDFSQSEAGLLYIAMEYLDGDSLMDIIERAGRLEPRRALSIARQIARGLSHAHERGVVHRDLKSANVIVVREDDEDDVAKILDLGVARLRSDTRLTRAGAIVGTPAYMAPEQILGGEVDARADLYALGVTLHEMLTGTLPYDAESLVAMARLQQAGLRAPLASALGESPFVTSIDELLGRLLAANVADRFASARDVVRAIQQILDGEHPSAVAAAAPVPPPVDGMLLESLRRAIVVGAPTYNAGDHQRCYEIYRAAADEALRSLGPAMGLATCARLGVALASAERAGSPTLRAWTMRHAFDDLLGAQPAAREGQRDAVDRAIDEFGAIVDRVYALGHEDAVAPFHLDFAARLRALLVAIPSRASAVGPFDAEVRAAAAGAPDACAGHVARALDAIRQTRSSSQSASGVARTAIGPPVARIDDAARQAILRAIRIGVPAYNGGDHAACAREYLRTAEAIVVESRKSPAALALASWMEGVVHSARTASPHDAAWAVRRAFDALLSLP